MTDRMQGVVPMLSYENGTGAIEWLTQAFGFTEILRMTDDSGRLTHAELETGNGILMLASPTPDYESPLRHRNHCRAAQKWSEVPWIIDGVLVYVKNIQSHFEQAEKSGARILSAIETGGPGPRYRCEDPEGHRWMFMQQELT